MNDRMFGWMFKIVPIFIGLVFLVIVLYWVFMAVVVGKVASEVNKNGAKALVERIWNGPNGGK